MPKTNQETEWPEVRLTGNAVQNYRTCLETVPAHLLTKAETYVPRSQVVELEEAAREAHHAIRETAKVLMAIQGALQQPYPDDPRWSPWTRFVDRSETTPWRLLCKADTSLRASLKAVNQGG